MPMYSLKKKIIISIGLCLFYPNCSLAVIEPLTVASTDVSEICIAMICIPAASCIIGKEIISNVGKTVFYENFFEPVISSSSGILYRHATSRMINMGTNEQMKSRAFEGIGRLEAQRYYINKKAADTTRSINKIKALQADATLLHGETMTLRAELMLYLISDKTNNTLSKHKKKLLNE